MIKSITLCVNHSRRIRKLGIDKPRVEFQPGYNVLVGPNGSGKSTLLKAIAGCPACVPEKTDGEASIKFVTTEVLNPLAGGSFGSREEMVQGIRSMFRSHGQGVRDSLNNQYHAGERIVLIDSPETGQDHENCLHLYDGLQEMAERYQLIVATNSLVFMRGGNLIDLGDRTVERLAGATRELLAGFGASGK